MTALKPKIEESRGFIVADTETLLVNKEDPNSLDSQRIHIPYAIGFCVVKPGDDI